MTFIIISLIVALLGGIVTLFFSSEMVGELYTTVFDCGQYLTTVSGVEFFSLLMPVSYGFGIMFAGDSFTDKKLSDSIDTSDSLLRQLKPNETAMSVTVRSLANGLSGKLQQGDIIQIVSVDEDDKAQIYEELQYVEVLATTSDKGSDDTYRDGEVNADDEDSGDQSLYATVTIILQDRAQALRLAECENTSLHAVFVTRGDEKLKAECLKAQLELLTGEISTAEADGTSEPEETPEPTAESEESNG